MGLPDARVVIDAANRLYYESGVWRDTFWLGVPTQKCPLDLWIYQEILVETRPDVIIETGTAAGGSALYLAAVCELIGCGEVITVDIRPIRDKLPQHSRITYIGGQSSTSDEVLQEIEKRVHKRRAMVILDSDHKYDHVLAELGRYAPFVSFGCYLIVEDTNLNGHPVWADYGPGPWEALRQFLSCTDQFETDRSRDKLMLSFNPCGYLRRVR